MISAANLKDEKVWVTHLPKGGQIWMCIYIHILVWKLMTVDLSLELDMEEWLWHDLNCDKLQILVDRVFGYPLGKEYLYTYFVHIVCIFTMRMRSMHLKFILHGSYTVTEEGGGRDHSPTPQFVEEKKIISTSTVHWW